MYSQNFIRFFLWLTTSPINLILASWTYQMFFNISEVHHRVPSVSQSLYPKLHLTILVLFTYHFLTLQYTWLICHIIFPSILFFSFIVPFPFFKKTMYFIYQGSANQKIPYRFMLGTFLSEDIIVQQLHIQFLSCYPLFIEIYTSPCRLFTGDRLHHWGGGRGRTGNALEASLSYWPLSPHLLFLCGRCFYL